MWKIILAAASGLAIGGTAGWFFTKRHYETLVESRIAEELKRFIERRQARMAATSSDEETTEAPEEFDRSKVVYENLADPYTSDESTETTRYSKIWKGGVRDVTTAPPSPNKPFLISEDAWSEGVPGYGSESLSYYLDGDLLIDDESGVLDIDETIGQDALEEFRNFETKDDIIFVRNPKLGMDYEVSLSRDRYYAEGDE